MQIKTAEGWKKVKCVNHNDTGPMTPMERESQIIRDVFCGWSPSPNGPESAENAMGFRARVVKMVEQVNLWPARTLMPYKG